MRIRVAIVSKEHQARLQIRQLLNHEPDVEVVGETDNGNGAVALIRQQHPDLVFLDVQLPEMNGLDVLRAFPAWERPARRRALPDQTKGEFTVFIPPSVKSEHPTRGAAGRG